MTEEKELTEAEEKSQLLQKLKEEWNIEEEIQFNEFNIQEKLQKNVFVYSQYMEQYTKEKSALDKLIEMRDALIAKRYDYYRFEDDRQLQKPEIEKYYLPKDKQILKLNRIIRIQQYKVDFFNICCKALDKMGWNMKNFIEANRRI